MPVRNLTREILERDSESKLLTDLVQEWENPNPQAEEPEILLEERSGGITRVYVVWSKWEGLDLEHRSAIILDAAKSVLGEEAMRQISIAWGMTPDEKRAFGLK